MQACALKPADVDALRAAAVAAAAAPSDGTDGAAVDAIKYAVAKFMQVRHALRCAAHARGLSRIRAKVYVAVIRVRISAKRVRSFGIRVYLCRGMRCRDVAADV